MMLYFSRGGKKTANFLLLRPSQETQAIFRLFHLLCVLLLFTEHIKCKILICINLHFKYIYFPYLIFGFECDLERKCYKLCLRKIKRHVQKQF